MPLHIIVDIAWEDPPSYFRLNIVTDKHQQSMRAWPPRGVSTHLGKSGKSCIPDPFSDLSPYLEALRKTILGLVDSGYPLLSEVTQYYLQQPSKQIRPLLVILFSQATNGLGKDWQLKFWESTHPGGGGCQDELDLPFSPPHILVDYNSKIPQYTEVLNDNSSRLQRKPYSRNEQPPPLLATPTLHPSTDILPTQRRMAIISEIIHTASLLHDDAIDSSALRRGVPSAPAKFKNKLSVLGGHYMIARAFAALVQLRNPEVTQMVSRGIQNLIEGEMIQMKNVIQAAADDVSMKLDSTKRSRKHQDIWNTYLQKSYLKTGSLIARNLRAAVMLGGCVQGEIWREVAYAYGRNLGIAFQVSIYPIFDTINVYHFFSL